MLLRASPSPGLALEAADSWAVHVGGAEANVAVHLARLGESAAMVTWLPDSPLGWKARRWLQWHGVDTCHVTMTSGGRMGLYFTEMAHGGRRSTVVYDRESTPIRAQTALPAGALDDAWGVHLTGITAVCAATLFQSTIAAAIEQSVPISYDCNYRASLGPVGPAREVFDRVAGLARWIFIARDDAVRVLGIGSDATEIAVKIRDRYPHAVCVVSDGAHGAVAAEEDRIERADAPNTHYIDGIGRGDALCAGFHWGSRRGDLSFALRCGVALAALSQTHLGDSGWVTQPQLDDLLSGSASGAGAATPR
jgi:2-dehydro-3-deoxygluconokinase